MTDDINKETTQRELDLLKEQATRMGINFHPNIGLETLQAKIDNFKQESDGMQAATLTSNDAPKFDPTAKPENVVETPGQKQKRVRDEAMRLVRVRVACMNPNKKEWDGEILTVANKIVGTMKKYIPFNNDEGWHIPYMMYLHLKERECQIFVKKKNDRGRVVAVPKMIKEFAIERLPDLTAEEMKDLAQRQAMANGTSA